MGPRANPPPLLWHVTLPLIQEDIRQEAAVLLEAERNTLAQLEVEVGSFMMSYGAYQAEYTPYMPWLGSQKYWRGG